MISNHIQDQRNYNQRKLVDFDQDRLINLLSNKYSLDYYQAKHHNLEKLVHTQEPYLENLQSMFLHSQLDRVGKI